MGSLGQPRKPHDLSYLTKPVNDIKDITDVINSTPINNIIEDKAFISVKDTKPIEDRNDIIDDVDILVSYRIKGVNVMRLYSEMFWDPRRRALKDIVNEILEEGLKNRPYKGPASAEFVAGMKSRGKHKKS